MNKPYVYLPISFLVILAILQIAFSVSTFNLMLNFTHLLLVSLLLTAATGIIMYLKYKNTLDGENLYLLTGSTVLFSFVIWLAFISLIDKAYATKSCNFSSLEVVGYKGRLTSGYGKLKKEDLKANQWILTVLKDEEKETFVLDQDIFNGENVTKQVDLEFCKGLLGTEYLTLEQL